MSTATDNLRSARDFLVAHASDYDEARRVFQWPEFTDLNWAIDWFDAELATQYPNALALKIVGENSVELTFGQLSAGSNRIANGLRALGVRRGDRLMLMLSNCAALWETMLAAMKLGAITVPTSTLCTAEDVATRAALSGAKFIVTNSSLAASFNHLSGDLVRIAIDGAPTGWVQYADLNGDDEFAPSGVAQADDPILLYFTSGTTAQPKLVLHSHRSYGVGALSTMYWLGLRPGDMHLNISSPGWAKHAWSCFFTPWNAAACVFISNQPRFDAKALLGDLAENPVTSLCAPPTVWRMLIQEDLAAFPVGLRSACSAGEPLNPEVIEAVERAWGLTIRDGFGQTETTAQIANTPGQPVKVGSVGRPLPGYDVVLLNEAGQEADEGEIALRLTPAPAGLMRGYMGDGGEPLPILGDFYRTGDVASRDQDGWYTYVGRADDVFKAADYRISPFELESALIEHPAVIEAAVVPAPDPIRTSVPKAFVTLASSASAQEDVALDLFRHIARTLAPYKRVRRIEFGELPKTISGKIRRVELRRLELERFAEGTRPPVEFREEDFPVLREERPSGR